MFHNGHAQKFYLPIMVGDNNKRILKFCVVLWVGSINKIKVLNWASFFTGHSFMKFL